MGSFANSLHVRCDSAASVVEEIRKTLENQGFEARADAPGGDDLKSRAIHVTEPRGGWVGVLDSDMMGQLNLAQELSFRLQTHTICVVVNDSDSWHYELFHRGHEIDGFDSPGGEPLLNLDELPAEMLEMPDAGEMAEAMQAVMGEMPELAELLQSLLPPEMRALHEKIAAGTASEEEAAEFSDWTQQLAEDTAAEFGESIDEAAEAELPVAATEANGNGQAASKKQLKSHLHHLWPLLAQGVDTDRLEQILCAKAIFAEETLADFLAAIGVSDFFARLSWEYLAEFSSEDLKQQNVNLGETLRFDRTQ